ncbi:hypothetical protein ELUMI_v1c05620 [Williamsoniiplasma luminosum]|uniref:Uncharacterized protein n=1 Tax=Williamsoniiplasma luminosum TaxID=214888 RepID=A0A2K8NUR7_9MOLU|nr:hypothetical protein ELUMI_v1c05620 [Williamsoniiplasma luminosum]
MKKFKLHGLTNKVKVKKNKVVKKSSKKVDYFIDRENENNFYQQSRKFILHFNPQ